MVQIPTPQGSVTSAAPGDCETPSVQQPFPNPHISSVSHSSFNPSHWLDALFEAGAKKIEAKEAASFAKHAKAEALATNLHSKLLSDSEVLTAARSENASILEDLRRNEFSKKIDLMKEEVSGTHIVIILDNSTFWPGKLWDGSSATACMEESTCLQNDRNHRSYGLTTPNGS